MAPYSIYIYITLNWNRQSADVFAVYVCLLIIYYSYS